MTSSLRSLYGPMFRLCFAVAFVAFAATMSQAFEVLGTGTDALLGDDLTDRGDNGDEGAYFPPDLGGYDAEFFSSDEPGFSGANTGVSGELAFNVFDNKVSSGQDKWCCGGELPQIVGAVLSPPVPHLLTHFTVASGNDVPNRSPRVWTIDGSNDGTNWTTIFSQDDPSGPIWDANNQVIRFNVGTDFAPPEAFLQFRMVTTETGMPGVPINTPANGNPFFQINEIEFFGEPFAGTPGDVNGDDVVDNADFEIIRQNFFQTVTNRGEEGDLNFDGVIDFDDFRKWKDARFAGGAASSAVPEPTCLMITLIAGLGLLIRRRSR